MRSFYRLLLALFILAPLFASAQGYYKQGFVITTKGDTLKGYIDLKEWGSNPKDINFKVSLDKPAPQIFTVNDIRYFEIPGITAYRAFTGSISLDETNIQRLAHIRDTATKTDRIFLKVIQRGKNIILYSYEDALKKRFYIYDSQAKTTTELIYRIYYSQTDEGNIKTITQNAYKQQLLLTAQKFDTYNDKLNSAIEAADYEENDVITICRKINNTKKEDFVKSSKKYVTFFIGAAGDYNTIHVTGTSVVKNGPKSPGTVNPKITLGVNFYPFPEVGKSIIKFEFSYTNLSYKTNGFLNYYDPNNASVYSLKQSTFSFTPQFQYNIYNTDPFKLYLNVGFSANFSKYSKNSLYDPQTAFTQDNYAGLASRWFSVPVKTGIILNKHLDISVTYYYPQAFTNNGTVTDQEYDYSFKLQTIQLGLSYIF